MSSSSLNPKTKAEVKATAPPRAWFVYLIECLDGSLYAGVAVDVAARYKAHASGKGARYTRSHPPRALLAAQQCADRSSALKAEYRLKQLSAPEKRQWAAKLGSPQKP